MNKIVRILCLPISRLLIPCLLVLSLGLVAVWPLLSRPMPNTDDGMLHALRIMQLDRCLRHGVLCLRWAPDMALGYGYPGFNFYLNLPTWIAEGYHLLGLNPISALAVALATAVILAGLGAFVLGRDLGGPWAGLIAATAYMYAPYQFFDVYYRGNLAETWALAWLPWLLWAARRAATSQRWGNLIPFAVLYAAQLYTHNIYTMIGAPVLLGYLLLLWWTGERSRVQALRIGIMLALGLALGAFYWLPAFFEQTWVQYTPAMFDYTRHFLTLRELFAAPPAVDTALLNFFPPRSLSWGMLGSLLIGVAGCVWNHFYPKNQNDRRTSWTTLAPLRFRVSGAGSGARSPIYPTFFFFLLVLIAYAWHTLDLTQGVWDALPPLHVVQMPWRLLGPASLAGSLCAGMAFARGVMRFPRTWQTILVAAALAVILITAVPWTYAPSFPQPAQLTVADMLRWELSTGLIGTTSVNEFLPRWASMPPDPADPTLLDEPSKMAERLDADTLPPGSRVLAADYRPMRAVLTLDLSQATRIVYKQFYFPGWQVRIDGHPAIPVITAPYGLLGIDVPAGVHRIEVLPAATPLRAAGIALSIAAGIGLVLIGVIDRRQATIAARQSNDAISNAQYVALFILAFTWFVLKIVWIDRLDTPLRNRRFDGQRVPYARTQTAINLGNAMTLYGYTLPTAAVPADRPLRVDLYVGVQHPLDTDWMAYARLVDETGQLWSLRDNGTPDDLRALPPTTAWPTGMIGHWAYLTYPLPGTPSGRYWIEIAFFERGTWRTLPVLDAQGLPVGLKTRIGPVEIGAARRQPLVENLGIAEPLNWDIDGTLRLLGGTLERDRVQSGDTLHLTLFWQATARPERNRVVGLALMDGQKALCSTDNVAPGGPDHPAVKWRVGEIVRSQHTLRIPPTTSGGIYRLDIVVTDDVGMSAHHTLGSITVHAPERTMSVPAVAYRSQARLGEYVTLIGFNLDSTTVAAGGTLSITLFWQARQEMNTAYTVFVQLVGAAGVLTQVDATPVNGIRPTTGWIDQEVIADPYILHLPADVPPGEYQLIAGMYDPNTLRRLPVFDATGQETGNYILLAAVRVR